MHDTPCGCGIDSDRVRDMSTLAEIEAAAKALPVNEQSELVRKLMHHIRLSGSFLAEPRKFTTEEMQEWFDEDEREGREIRELLGIEQA